MLRKIRMDVEIIAYSSVSNIFYWFMFHFQELLLSVRLNKEYTITKNS